MKSEPGKRPFKCTVGEDKVLWLKENRKLRTACRARRAEGVRTRKFHLVRDWFMVEVGLLAGLRVMEMRGLLVGDLLIRDSLLSIRVRHGKGGRRRDVWISQELKQACLDFLRIRQKFSLPNEPESHLFCSEAGKPVTTRALQKAFKRCLAEAGLSASYSIHCLRHTYATFLLDLSNLRVVQEELGHSSVKTTEVYTSLIQNKVKEALERIYKQ